MKHSLTAILLSLLPVMALPQIAVDNRAACYDSITGIWIATVPERIFYSDCELTVGTGPSDVSRLLFRNLCADSTYTIAVTDAQGNVREEHLRFTFLPVVQLLPSAEEDRSASSTYFGNDYRPALVLFSHPDSAATDTLTARVKWRGGTTNAANKHKRNYKLNFDEDHRFFGLRNDDKWMLDAGQADVFRLRNRIAMDLWNKMARKPYYSEQEPKALNGVRGQVVEVFVGSEWMGIYNFSEFMDRKQLKLKKVDSQTGEIRGCLYKGVSWGKVQFFDYFDSYDNTKDTFYGYEMKYPELGDDSDTVDWAPLVEANNFAKNSTNEEFKEHVEDYFDMPVVMDYNIFYNVVNAVDNAGKNMYWAVYDKTQTQRLTLTPWDLDATFGQRWGGQLIREVDEGFYNSPEFRMDFELALTYRMFRDNFNDYIGQLNERYRYLRQPGQPLHTDSILAIVDHYYHAVKHSGAAAREETKWSGDSDVWGDVIDFDTEYAYICDWIRRRMDFIDQTELPLFYKQSYFDELDISTQVTMASIAGRSNIYDLSGRKVNKGNNGRLKPGVYISDSRKIFMR